jgi:hypothetical protein
MRFKKAGHKPVLEPATGLERAGGKKLALHGLQFAASKKVRRHPTCGWRGQRRSF